MKRLDSHLCVLTKATLSTNTWHLCLSHNQHVERRCEAAATTVTNQRHTRAVQHPATALGCKMRQQLGAEPCISSGALRRVEFQIPGTPCFFQVRFRLGAICSSAAQDQSGLESRQRCLPQPLKPLSDGHMPSSYPCCHVDAHASEGAPTTPLTEGTGRRRGSFRQLSSRRHYLTLAGPREEEV
jgi:hypothetical protein